MLKQDHYVLLGVAREAETNAIEQACNSALLVTSDSAERARLRHARDTLCAPERRTAYDRSLRTIPTPLPSMGRRIVKPAEIKNASQVRSEPILQNASLRWLWLGLAALLLVGVGLAYVYLFAKPSVTGTPVGDTKGSYATKPSTTPPKLGGKNPIEPQRQPSSDHRAASESPDANANLSPDTVYATASPSVLVVESVNNAGATSSRGSGVVVGPDLVVTSCYLVQYAAAIRLRSASSDYTAMPDIADSTLDMCLLRVPGLNVPAALRNGLERVQVGQDVVAVGASRGAERLLSQGRVSALRESGGVVHIQTSAPIARSALGGGLFDTEGRLIGITTDQHKLGPNLNLALPIGLLDSLRHR